MPPTIFSLRTKPNTNRPYISHPIPLIRSLPGSANQATSSTIPRTPPAYTPTIHTHNLTHPPTTRPPQPALLHNPPGTSTLDRQNTYERTFFPAPPTHSAGVTLNTGCPLNRDQHSVVQTANEDVALPAYISYGQMRLQEEVDAEAQRNEGKKRRDGCVNYLVGEGMWKRSLVVLVVCTVAVGVVVLILVVRGQQGGRGQEARR